MDVRFFAGLARDWGLALVAVVGAYLLWALVFAPSPITEGPAPDFTLPSTDGHDVTLSSFAKDDVVVLNFWFTNCGPCRHEIPELEAFHEEHPEIPMLGVSIDTMPTYRLKAAAEQLGIRYAVLHDPQQEVAGEYDVSTYPTTFVLRKGQIAVVRVGEVDRKRLEQMTAR